ncbi:MAG: Ubiquinone/menaquinone biosynthesis C-methyltransferase UbiE [Candidatus Heimdallarchaeota archaeon LC_2]|nr:MAG: Ubiquinone/menaquinone biosynthesis C-methyltransferase UbiE [Candidatus Heimdallarchaeota archaeon LC_2]
MDELEIQKKIMERMIQTYDRVHNKMYWDEIHPFIEELAKGRCIDIGCGPGLLLQEVDQKYKSEKLFGIDLSPVMLEKAKEILQQPIVEGRVELIQQHMQENSELPSDIDVIFSSRVLRSFNDQIGTMKSINSSLKRGGRLILLDWDLGSIEKYNNYFNSSEEFNEIELSEIICLHRNFSRYSIEDWRFILENTGFKIDFTFQLNPVHIVVIASKI